MQRRIHASQARFDDFDRFAAAFAGAGGDVIPLVGGPWEATLATVGLGSIELYRVQVPPQLRTCTLTPGDLLLTARTLPGATAISGQEIRGPEIALHGVGAPIEARFRQPTTWLGVQFLPGSLMRLAEEWRRDLPGRAQHRVLDPGAQAQQGLLAVLETAIGTAIGSPGLLDHPGGVAGLHRTIEIAVTRLLAGPAAWREQPRATGARLRVVRAARDYMMAHPSRAAHAADLCAAIGVAPRTLHAAFASVYGCSPHAVLKRRRLAMVRRALLEGGPGLLVKTVALDHGFWHLGHFAADYRAMFGEHPRETRVAARAEAA